MAAAKKKKSKKKASRKKGRGRRGLTALLVMASVVAAVVIAFIANRPVPEVSAQATVLARMGSHGAAAGQLDSPRGIAADALGNVYVADLSNARINKYSPDGKFLLSFGKHGDEQVKNGPYEFREPSGVAVDKDGNVFVADAWNGRVAKYDSKGKFVTEYSGPRYSFYSPRNVAVDGNGNFYVADTGNSVIKAYGPSGNFLKEVGGHGKGGGHFNEVFGIAVDARGYIYAADPGNQRIHKFSPLPEAKFLKDRKVPGWQEGTPFWPHLAVDSMGHLYASDNNNRKVWIYDTDLNYLATLGGQPGKELFAGPLGLAAAGGDLYVGDMGANLVLRLGDLRLPASKP
jgi:sugar lactone lactonase YvrE